MATDRETQEKLDAVQAQLDRVDSRLEYAERRVRAIRSENFVSNFLGADIGALGAVDTYLDFVENPTPDDPDPGTRRVFADDSTNKLSVRTSGGTTVNLEYGDVEAIVAVEGEGTLDLGGAVTVAGNFAVDSPVFYVDAGDDFIGMGTAASNTENQLKILMAATKDILIDGSTNPREIDTGVMRWEQKPAIENTRALTLNIDINSQANTQGIVVNMRATQLAPGEIISALDLLFDSANATGGHAHGLEVSMVGSGLDDVTALHANPGVEVIHHGSGVFGAVDNAFKYDGSFTDVTTAFNSAGTDVQLFVANGDVVYIGMAAVFDHIEAILETAATGAGVKPTFAFSDGVGGFTDFTPEDGSRGFRENGVIEWHLGDIAAWAADEVNSIANKYWIRITRTQGGAITGPTEDTIQVQAITEYYWNKDGDLVINGLTVAGNIVVGGTVDGVDIAAHPGLPDIHHVAFVQGDADALYDVLGGLSTHAAAGDPHPLYALDSDLHSRYTDTEAVTAAKTVKLDDFATPDDNTDLDATTSLHGLLLKLGGGTTNFLRADGTWAAPAGDGSGTLTTIKENDAQVGGADIEVLDFLGADFDLTETPDKEIQIIIAAAIARVSALHNESHTLASHSTKPHSALSDAPAGAHHVAFISTDADALIATHAAIGSVHHVAFVQGDADALYDVLGGLSTHAALDGVHHTLLHGAAQHNAAALPGTANENLGAFYLDIDDIAVPTNPGAGVRRLFTDTATGELSVRTNAGATVSLEGAGGGGGTGAFAFFMG